MFVVARKPDDEYQSVLDGVQAEFPKFKLVKKSESRFMRVIDKLLFFNKTFMTSYVTTIGNTLYITDTWDEQDGFSRAATLRHERIHLRQQQRYGFLLYCILYLLVLPFVFTFRAKLEKEAYKESMRAWFEYRGDLPFTLARREGLIKQFTSGAYGWMCPFRGRMERWYDETLKKVREEDWV